MIVSLVALYVKCFFHITCLILYTIILNNAPSVYKNEWGMCTSIPITEIYYLRHWCRHKMDVIFQTFWNTFYFNEKVWISIVVSLKCVPKVQYCSIDWDHVLAPIRHQAIILVNDGLVYFCIYSVLNDLNLSLVKLCGWDHEWQSCYVLPHKIIVILIKKY